MYKTRLLFCVLCCCFLNAKSESIPPNRYVLWITVTDSVTNLPLEAASITLAELQLNAITNSVGVVMVDSLPKGWYTIQCSFIGYHTLQHKVWIEEDTRVQLLLCPESNHLHEVSITTHLDELRDFTVQTKTTITTQQIERVMGNTFADLLKQVPGVTVLSNGPAIAKPVIRGLHSNRIVTINNGIRQEGQQWGSDHGAEIDPFAPASIDVIKGAASVEYGAEAMGGVVRIHPKPYRQTVGMNAELKLLGATNNGMGATSMLVEGAHFKKHQISWRAQGSFRKAGDSRTPEYVMSNTGFEELSGSYGLHYGYKQFHAELAQSYYHNHMGILRAAHVGNQTDLVNAIKREQPAFVAPFTYNIQNPSQQVMHLISSVKMWYTFNKQTKLYVQLSRQSNDRAEYDRPSRLSQRLLYNNTPAYKLLLQTSIVETKLEHRIMRNVHGVVGVNWMNQGNVSEGLQPILPNYRAHTYGVFAIEKWQHGRWMAEAGLRYDWRDQTRYIYQNGIQSNRMQFGNATAVVGSGYMVNEYLKINANISSAWRPPSINELYSYGLHGGTATFEIGNPNLVPERSVNAEIGFVLHHAKWKGSVTMFRNQFQNFIYRLPNPTPTLTVRGSFPMMNFVQDNALLQGIELNTTRELNKAFSVGVNASYLYAQNTSDNIPLVLMPANRAQLMVTYQRDRIWKLNGLYATMQYAFVAHQHRFPQGIDLMDPPPAYGLMDVNAGFNTQIGKQPLRFSLSIVNVLNTSYRDYLSNLRYFTLEPGVNFIARLTIPFTIYQPKN